MTIENKWRYVFRKDMSLRFNRAKAYWAFGENFYEFKVYATRQQLMDFFKDWAGIERSCRKVLQEKEFQLKPEQDAKRLEKAATMKEKYKSPITKAKEDYDKYLG